MKYIKRGLLLMLLCMGWVIICSCGDSHVHEFNRENIAQIYRKRDATCESAAAYYYSCSCGAVGDKTFIYGNPKIHEYEDYRVTDEATCEEHAKETGKCKWCALEDIRVIDDSALGHDLGEYIYDNNATCESDGTETASCQRDGCQKTDTRTKDGSMLPHPFKSDWSSNETHHWHDSTCQHELRSDYGTHNYVNDICSDCQYEKPEVYIESIEGADIKGTEIYLPTKADTFDSAVKNIITSPGASYQIFEDAELKVLVDVNAAFETGENVFYINVISPEASVSATYTLTVYKSFKITVTYLDMNAEDIYEEETDAGFIFTPSYVPTDIPEGYESFKCWLLNGTEYSPMILHGGVSLSACFKEKDYKITLNYNGGSISSTAITVTYGKNFTLPLSSQEGYKFLGWFDADDKEYTSGIWTYTSDVTLTAKWEKKEKYTITLDPDGGDVSTKQIIVIYGELYTLPDCVKSNYTFLGWFDSSGTRYIGGTCNLRENITLTAKWEKKSGIQLPWLPI